MGDGGFLWKSRKECRKVVVDGDTTWCKGKVVQKYCGNGRHCVDIEVLSVNQTGAVTVTGSATVILPSREHGPMVYPEPYPRVP